MAKKEKYAWTYSDDNEMFFYPKDSTNSYLSGKGIHMPKRFFDDKSGKIKSALKNSPSMFSHYGIIRAGFSRKTKNYYQVIGKNPFFTVFLIESGELPILFKNKKTRDWHRLESIKQKNKQIPCLVLTEKKDFFFSVNPFFIKF